MSLSSSLEVLSPIRLWADAAPGALGSEDHDIPTLTPYLPSPDKATGAAMVIFPGGAYAGLAGHEGDGYAQWLAGKGIASFVLKYRLGSKGYRHPAMLNDATRAVRLVRSRATQWKIDPQRIGVIGSSAGGHLAATILTHYTTGNPSAADLVEHESSRPDLGILCYPVVTLGKHTHEGSKENLLGKDPLSEMVEKLSGERQVTKDTPPCFLWHTWEDGAVVVENSLQFATALRENGVRFEIHVYELGGHGLGLGGANPHRWALDCEAWLTERGFIKA